MVQDVDLRKCYAQTALNIWTTLVFMRLFWSSEQIAIISLYSNLVETELLNITYVAYLWLRTRILICFGLVEGGIEFPRGPERRFPHKLRFNVTVFTD
jgi:hypothetical protein